MLDISDAEALEVASRLALRAEAQREERRAQARETVGTKT